MLALLKVRWRGLPKDALRRHLQSVILAERASDPAFPRRLKDVPRFALRKRRIELARRYVELGGVVSGILFARHLPTGRNWGGIISLVSTPGFDEYLRAPSN